jgi:DNA-binding response OmpR family regulator
MTSFVAATAAVAVRREGTSDFFNLFLFQSDISRSILYYYKREGYKRDGEMHVLIVEDDVPLTRQISAALLPAGHEAAITHNGETALQTATETAFDLLVIDIGLPGIDGFELLRRLRSLHVKSRVLMLTARGETKDRIAGLQLGADDYLAKPFSMAELVARIEALGRRYPEEPVLTLHVADLSLDLVNHEAHRGAQRIELSQREFMLLKVLMREPGRVFTRTELCERVWEHQHDYDARLVEVFIGRLRRKIGEPSLIRTVRHVGYTLREARV